MCLSQKNNFHSVDWGVARPSLLRALDGYDPSKEIQQGKAFCFRIADSFALIRSESFEMVVIAFDGENKLKNAAPLIVQLAKQIKAKSIRVHAKRPSECRYLNMLGLDFKYIGTDSDSYQILRMRLDG